MMTAAIPAGPVSGVRAAGMGFSERRGQYQNQLMELFNDQSDAESNEHDTVVTIPENINELSPREAAEFYQDRPAPPSPTDPGKKAVARRVRWRVNWRELDAKEFQFRLDQIDWIPGKSNHLQVQSAFGTAENLNIDPDTAEALIRERVVAHGGKLEERSIRRSRESVYGPRDGDGAEPARPEPKAEFDPGFAFRVAGRLDGVDAVEILRSRSDIDPGTADLATILGSLYRPGEKILVFEDRESQGHLIEVGAGLPADLPLSADEGIFFLTNPVDGEYHPNPREKDKPSRRSGESITEFRYLLLESDEVPAEEWLRILVQLPLPIAAVYSSGGKSIHSLVRIDARIKADYDEVRRGRKALLVALGADPMAMSAVRLSRLPTAYRGPRKQELLYLKAQPENTPIIGLPNSSLPKTSLFMKSNMMNALAQFAAEHGRPELIALPGIQTSSVTEPAQQDHPFKPVPSGKSISEIDGSDRILPLSNQGLPPIRSLGDWLDPGPLPDPVVEGLLGRGMKMVLGGSSKTHKTWNLINLGVSVASGRHWLGFPCRKGRVLYINFEIMEAFCHRRLMQVASEMGLSHGELDDLHVWNLRGFARGIVGFVDEIEKTLIEGGYSMLIFDPIYKLLGDLSENSAEAVATVMNELDRLAVRCNAAVVFAHHFSKGNQSKKEAIDRVSGSGVWARDPDTLMMITRHKEDDAFTVSTILRNYPPVEDFVLRWQWPLLHRCEDLDPAQVRGNTRTATFSLDQVLAVLRTAGAVGMTTGEWQTACSDQLGMSLSTFHNKMKQLRDSGRSVVRDGRNFVAGDDPTPGDGGVDHPPSGGTPNSSLSSLNPI